MVFLLFIGNIFAQKKVQKTLESNTLQIQANFTLVNTIQIIGTDNSNAIEVLAENEDSLSANFILKEENNTIIIKGIEGFDFAGNNELIDKQCTVQPLFNMYTLKIPNNRKIVLTCGQGNISVKKFTGDLDIQLDEGILLLNTISGNTKLQLHTGKIVCEMLQNVQIDIKTEQGTIRNDFGVDKKANNSYKTVLGNPKNKLLIQAISANVELHAVK